MPCNAPSRSAQVPRQRQGWGAALLLAIFLAACQGSSLADDAAPRPGPAVASGGADNAAPVTLGQESPGSVEAASAPVRLRAALARYRAIEAAGGWPTVPDGPNLEAGAEGARVALLRRRLQATGDLDETAAATAPFDAALDSSVRRFQARHGLAVDGIVGRRTLAALNRPVGARIATLELNLRRLEREARDWGERYLVVNVAAARYRLVEPGRPTVERPAIVGRPDWETPSLEGLIDRLEFNPTWTVPPRILRLELLPKIERDPDYLARHDMEWVDGLLRQAPGPNNPLGRVKFLFDNPYSVYLHDTSSPRLFERAERFLSHGCVRVADALDLARRLLRGDPDWPAERIEAVVASGRTERVRLSRPLPLHIVYDTAWVEENGIVNFRDDVYGRDRQAGELAQAGAEQSGLELTGGSCPAEAWAG